MTSTSLPHTWIGSPNYTRGRDRVDYISLHIMAGFLAGTDSTFAKLSAGTSSTYGIGANGDIHQYVDENDTAFADGNYTSNRHSISIEHEGGLTNAPNTDACVQASARLCADIARRYGWTQLIHGQNIRLHREIPPYSHRACPDKCPNPLRWEEIITLANQLLNGEDMPNAGDLWNYELGSDGTANKNNTPAWIHLSYAHADTAALRAQLLRTDDAGTGDGSNGDMYTRICYMDMRIREMSATMTAQAEALKTLATAIGADPNTIADTVAKAVKNKLDQTTIKMVTSEGN